MFEFYDEKTHLVQGRPSEFPPYGGNDGPQGPETNTDDSSENASNGSNDNPRCPETNTVCQGCTSADHLKKFLHDSSVDNESEKHLEENCISLGLKFSSSTLTGGHRFFKVVTSQLRRLGYEKMSPKTLRKSIADHLRNNTTSTKMMKNGESADYLAVFGTAQKLKRDIVIVKSTPNSNPEKIVTWIVGEPNFSGDPLLLGHCKNQYWNLEPIQKSENRGIATQERVCEMRGNAVRAAGCTKPDDLKKVLCDYSESEKRLKQNCSSVGLKFGTPTEKNGDCFFIAVFQQLRRQSLQENLSSQGGQQLEAMKPEQLRKKVVDYYSNKNKREVDDQVHAEEILSKPIDSWCTKMKQEGAFADLLAVSETAKMLERDIIVVTSSTNSNPQQNVIRIVGKPGFSGEALLLGHYWPNYYQSLESITDDSTNPDDWKRVLHDSELNESEIRQLRQNCRSVGLRFSTNAERNEDSFFEAVCAQLRHRKLQEGLSKKELQRLQAKLPKELEKEVTVLLSAKSQTSSGQCPTKKQESEFADYLVVVETAQVLKTDIVLVTSSTNSNPQQNVTWIVGKSDFKGEPLLLGYYWPKYYQSLEPIIQKEYRPKSTIEWVTEMRKYAIKDFTCTCHEEILLKKYQPGDLAKGDHIMRPVDSCCCGLICFHHAIFESDADSEQMKSNREQTNIKFNSISFAKEGSSYGNKSTVRQNPEETDLKKVDMYKVEYHYPKNTYETVFTEAESLQMNDSKYHLRFNNCEHVCRSCVTGESTSLQADLCTYHFQTIFFGCFPRLARVLPVILATISPEFVLPDNVKEKVHSYLAVVDSVATLFYLVMIVSDLCRASFRYKAKMLCPKCLYKLILTFIARFVFFLLILLGVIYCWLEECKAFNTECIPPEFKNLEPGLSSASLGYWFLLELYLLCSEKCRRNSARCLFFCLSCCECCSLCCKCCKHGKCRDRCDSSLSSCCNSFCKCKFFQNCENKCFEKSFTRCNKIQNYFC